MAVHKLDRFFRVERGAGEAVLFLNNLATTPQVDGASQSSRRMIICFCLITRIARGFSGTISARARRMRASSSIPLGSCRNHS